MSAVVKKCRKDGLAYDVAYAGQCEQCFAELAFYCKVHDTWLTTARCEKCDEPAIVAAAAPIPPAPARSQSGLWLVLFFLGCIVVLAGSVTVIWRIVGHRNKPALPVVAPAAPVVVPPVRQPAPPIVLSMSQIFSDPEPYLGKRVKTHGSLQLQETAKETFELRQANYVLQVKYAGLATAAKPAVATAALGRELTVSGVLNRDETLNALYLVADQIETE